MTVVLPNVDLSRVLFIAERAHWPEASYDLKTRAEGWDHSPVWRMLDTPAMSRGRTRQRLAKLLGVWHDTLHVVNLLPPDRKSGTWDARKAEKYARALRDVLTVGTAPNVHQRALAVTPPARIVLLGRRVGQAVWPNSRVWLRPGTAAYYGGVPTLYLPHPSERCRTWNDPAKAEDMQRAFWAHVSDVEPEKLESPA